MAKNLYSYIIYYMNRNSITSRTSWKKV